MRIFSCIMIRARLPKKSYNDITGRLKFEQKINRISLIRWVEWTGKVSGGGIKMLIPVGLPVLGEEGIFASLAF